MRKIEAIIIGVVLVLLRYWMTSKSAKFAFKVFRFFPAYRV